MDNKLVCGKTILTGNKAAAYGFALAELDVFGGYPITPSTEVTEEMAAMASQEIISAEVTEEMAQLTSQGIISATYRNTDSELASMALGIGVAAGGGRYGTATSSQGLALMFELLHWATTAQLPLVIANTNRSLGAPWSIHPDQTDSLLFRDLFMPQIYCSSAQEVLDMVLWAYRLSEDPLVSLPALVCFDGFMLSHTAEAVTVYKQESVRKFLPAKRSCKDSLLPEFDEKNIVNLQCPYNWKEHSRRKRALVSAMESAHDLIPEIAEEWQCIFGGSYGDGFLDVRGDAKAKIAVITMGSIVGTIEEALSEQPVKIIGLRFFRPFPAADLSNALYGVEKIVVFDRSILPEDSGVIASELLLRHKYFPQPIFGFVGGFGGQNLSEGDFQTILERVRKLDNAHYKTYWLGDE